MDNEYRCVILAEAGAGKTAELRQRASVLASQGKPAFFIRIEDIESGYHQAFEVGEEEQFRSWLESTGEAWFFLDSVDEARLDNPKTFKTALRLFSRSIQQGAHRAHIYISSRPYAWRPKEDKRLIDDILFLPKQQDDQQDREEGLQDKPKSALIIFVLRPLNEERVRRFCEKWNAPDIDRLIREIERANLWSMAERPFDLEGIVAKWCKDGELGGRLELLCHNIAKRLRDDHDTDRAQRQTLNIEKAWQGARRLAAAVILTGKVGLNVPGAEQVKPGIDAEIVLSDWDPEDVHILLGRGIFNDVIYGAVRFRHRDVRELLAAEWFDGLLKAGNSRYVIESLFFREQYGQNIVSLRLRPILPWLILFDVNILRRSLGLHPEIAVEGGDPSQLPLTERQRILKDIVRRIVSNQDGSSARDNSAITRIASIDLSTDAQKLIVEFVDNDEAIFFLGRLVWLGEMTNCIPLLASIAADSTRGGYARIASSRAVMVCGSLEEKRSLWEQINDRDIQIPRRLLAELVEEAISDSCNVAQLAISLGKLPPYERYRVHEIGHSLDKFIARFPVTGDQRATFELLDGLYGYLKRSPYTERGECQVSEEYGWLLTHAIYAIERLVEARSLLALGKTSLSIMLMAPALRFWREIDFDERKCDLKALVPAWPELNGALYWASIEQGRVLGKIKSNERLTDDWSVAWLGHFWNFDTTSLPRLIDYMESRALQDDRLVALSTAFRVFVQEDRSASILNSLQSAAVGAPIVKKQLNVLRNPPVPESVRRYEEEHAEYMQKQKEDEERKKQNREEWIAALQTNPEKVRNPPNLKPGKWSIDQHWLLHEIRGNGLKTSRTEGDIKDNSIQSSLIFALAGLEMEATEITDFPHQLNESEARHALRYITWDINGFPSWLECMHQAFPMLVNEAIIQELLWELENTGLNEPMRYILSDLAYHAPWLHKSIAPVLLEWVEANTTLINTVRHHCLHILVNGEIESGRIEALARREIKQSEDPVNISWWYALIVDCDPANGIAEVEQWLSKLDLDVSTHAAQIFVTALMGGRSVRDGIPCIGRFRKAEYLKSLYVLMHHYIRAKDDLNRANGGVYSPELRDDAQDARNSLYNLLGYALRSSTYYMLYMLTFINQANV